jgi:hypothetical protein
MLIHIVSGVFYINCHKELDKIKFFKDGYQTIKPEIKDLEFIQF